MIRVEPKMKAPLVEEEALVEEEPLVEEETLAEEESVEEELPLEEFAAPLCPLHHLAR